LSAAGFARVTAAVLKIFDFQPVIFKEQGNFFEPGLRAGEIGEEVSGAGAAALGWTHDFLPVNGCKVIKRGNFSFTFYLAISSLIGMETQKKIS
jgi:hypothetical protein